MPPVRRCAACIAQVAQQRRSPGLCPGIAAQLFLDRLDRGAEVGGRRSGCTGNRLENQPTVRVRSMSSNRSSRPWPSSWISVAALPGPAANGTRQCGQQQVIDLSAIGRRGLLQQLAGLLGIEPEFELVREAVLPVRRAGRSHGRSTGACCSCACQWPPLQFQCRRWLCKRATQRLVAHWFSAVRCRRL